MGKNPPGKQRAAIEKARMFLVLGAAGLIICWIYASFFYGGRSGGYSWMNSIADMTSFACREPAGGAMVLVSLILSVIGLVELYKSRK